MSGKTNRGWFFEDYFVGQIINHSVPRTLTSGERAIYLAAYPARHALYSSDEFARKCGFAESPLTELAAFHIIFGKTVPDISLNAVVGDGTKQGTMDAKTGAGMTPLECARKLVKGVEKRKAQVLIGRTEILAVYISRFFPNLLRRIMRKAAVT